MCVCVRVRVCVRACVRVSMHVAVCACGRERVCVCFGKGGMEDGCVVVHVWVCVRGACVYVGVWGGNKGGRSEKV